MAKNTYYTDKENERLMNLYDFAHGLNPDITFREVGGVAKVCGVCEEANRTARAMEVQIAKLVSARKEREESKIIKDEEEEYEKEEPVDLETAYWKNRAESAQAKLEKLLNAVLWGADVYKNPGGIKPKFNWSRIYTCLHDVFPVQLTGWVENHLNDEDE